MCKKSTVFVTMLVITCAGAACAATVPVPKVTPVPITADSYPLLANSKTLDPSDLAKAGYVEEEFILSGTANVYNWAADGTVSVKTPNAPYVTRILVRRPSNPSKFSGSVVVEIPNTARRFDWSMMWGYVADQVMEHGDAWVLASIPGSADGLKKFNPSRYASISFANPTPDVTCPAAAAASNKGAAGPRLEEEGLKWDILSQVASALKSGASGPMGSFKVQNVYMTNQGAEIVTYINAIHSHATLENGNPAYDGYLIKNAAPAGRLNGCAAAPPKDDLRRTIANVNVPVINVTAQGEVIASLPMRKPDSDDSSGRFRLYEIAGAAHIDRNGYVALPAFEDQRATGGNVQGNADFPFAAPCTPPIPLSTLPLLKDAFDAALANLEAWARKGTSPPKAERIALKDEGTAQVSLATDETGTVVGGVRSPWVDAPTWTMFTVSPGPGTCRELGHTVAFEADRLKTLYPDQKTYAAKVNRSIDRAVKEHLFTAYDAKKMKAELLAIPLSAALR
jgi:hypothetical protein